MRYKGFYVKITPDTDLHREDKDGNDIRCDGFIIEVFADAKEKHAMRYTNLRGLSQVTNWVRLKFATMNLKKYAIHRWKEIYIYLYFMIFEPVFA